jgi:adenine-specific DNA-methyltransferase
MKKMVADGMIVWKQVERNGAMMWWPYVKYYLEGRTKRPSPLWTEIDGSKKASRDLTDLFGTKVFDNVKPSELIRRILQISTHPDTGDLILDFFSGSGTTAQAVLEKNREDNGDRRFILVQLPEPTGKSSEAWKAGFQTIADVCKQRIRLVSAVMTDRDKGRFDLDPINGAEDIGFRVYRLDRSHFKPWTDYHGDDVAALQAQFDAFESPLVTGWQPDDLLVEIILIEGFPLDSTITRQMQFAANDVRLVESDFHEHRLWVCLDQRIEPGTALALVMADNDVFICLDSAVDDEMKLRLSDGGNLSTI